MAVPPSPRPLEVRDLGTVPYARALDLQRALVDRRRAGEIPDQILLLEHPHTITLGSSGRDEHLLLDREELASRGIEVHEAGRGGDVTYHGPGQLVGYPILDLKPDRKDLHRYIRDLEEVLIRALASLGVEGWREEGLTGVWTEGGKVAAIGVRVSSGWITSHGFALNVTTDVDLFRSVVVPCGIPDRPVTALRDLGGSILPGPSAPPGLEAGGPVHGGGGDPLMSRTRQAVLEAFCSVFGREIRVGSAEAEGEGGSSPR